MSAWNINTDAPWDHVPYCEGNQYYGPMIVNLAHHLDSETVLPREFGAVWSEVPPLRTCLFWIISHFWAAYVRKRGSFPPHPPLRLTTPLLNATRWCSTGGRGDSSCLQQGSTPCTTSPQRFSCSPLKLLVLGKPGLNIKALLITGWLAATSFHFLSPSKSINGWRMLDC